MFTIIPLSQIPSALDTCISWCNTEWQDPTGASPIDWIAEFQRIKDHSVDEVFVAMKEDTPVGMVWMLEHEGIDSHQHLGPWVSNLIVHHGHRKTGVARAMLAHIEAYIASGGDTTAYLLTRTPGIYFSSGWSVCDTAALDNDQVFVMQKSLSYVPSTTEDRAPRKEAFRG